MRRILKNSAVTAVALAFLYWLVWIYESSLRDPRFLDGWVLCAGIAVLFAFNVRKKLPMLPLGRATRWMQIHIYLGWFVIFAFGLHTGFSWPDGALNWALWVLFMLVSCSGIVGIYLTRSIPAKLEGCSERVLFQRIPKFRNNLAKEVEALAITSVDQAGSLTIADLYANTLHDFFRRPQNVVSHLRSSRQPLNRICGDLDKLARYLDAPGRNTLQAIKDLVVAKDDLDFQYANQGILKLWLFVHVPATHGLIVLIVAHAAIMYAFSSGVP